MHYILASILTPIFIEIVGEYTIKYDDINFHSVWYEENCLFENTTLEDARDYCQARLDLNGRIVFVLNTYFLSIKGQSFSKYVDEDCWHRRFHSPWIGFYPIPQNVKKGSSLFESLMNNFMEAEKMRRIKSVYKPYFTSKDRERYNRV